MGMIGAFARGWIKARDQYGGETSVTAEARLGNEDDAVDKAGAHEREELRRCISELQDVVERLKARTELFGSVLLLAGVKRHLAKAYHPDAHPGASEADRHDHGEIFAKINAAYEALEGDDP